MQIGLVIEPAPMATPLDIMGLLRPTAMDMEAVVFFQKLLFPFIYIYI
jgi:hypothetical protein